MANILNSLNSLISEWSSVQSLGLGLHEGAAQGAIRASDA